MTRALQELNVLREVVDSKHLAQLTENGGFDDDYAVRQRFFQRHVLDRPNGQKVRDLGEDLR